MGLRVGSVRLRWSLWYVAVLTAIILVFALGIYFFVRASLLRHIDNHLDRDFATVLRVARQGPAELKGLTRQGNVSLFRVAAGSAVMVETEGWTRTGLGQGLEDVSSSRSWTVRAPDGQPYRVKALRISSAEGGPLQIAVAHEEQTIRAKHAQLDDDPPIGDSGRPYPSGWGRLLSGWPSPLADRGDGGKGPRDNSRASFGASSRREPS